MRALAVSSAAKTDNVPSLKEQGLAVELQTGAASSARRASQPRNETA